MPAVLLIAVNNLSFSLFSCCCCSELVMAEGGPSKDVFPKGHEYTCLDCLKHVQEFAKITRSRA